MNDFPLRKPCNLYHDATRYKTLVALYILDALFLIGRLISIGVDTRSQIDGSRPFVASILTFDLLSSIPILFLNVFHVILRHCVHPLVSNQNVNRRLWQFATMTCFRPVAFIERPQAVLLERLIIITVSFLIRFICFVLAASCSRRFNPICTGYTVLVAFSLVFAAWILAIECLHFFRLWTYNPTDKRNTANKNSIGPKSTVKQIEKTHRRHLRFISPSLLNDNQAQRFRESTCPQGNMCNCQKLHHQLIYHSLQSNRDIENELKNEQMKRAFTAFHVTTIEEAYRIAESGFPFEDKATKAIKDYFHLSYSVYFTPTVATDIKANEAVICARLNLGSVIQIESDSRLNLDDYFARADGKCDTIFVKSNRKIFLRMPGQIEKWIIAFSSGTGVNDHIDEKLYRGCV